MYSEKYSFFKDVDSSSSWMIKYFLSLIESIIEKS